ncbi:MAG: 2-amino-4-hydroxy-6-hydroxymethyldihydropteridine diphosphokinase [Chlamydiales bacterium]
MQEELVYLGLGSNIGDSKTTLQKACQSINSLPHTTAHRFSSIYLTFAISSIPQRDYLNVTCSLITTLDPLTLFMYLEQIERLLGKIPKSKEAPRKIDIDILYFGNRILHSERLIIPHPKIKERLFVLQPLLELTDSLPDIPILEKYIKTLNTPYKVQLCE